MTMRLIDAYVKLIDKRRLANEIEQEYCVRCSYALTSECENCTIRSVLYRIDDTPTVEAIPVEQVARIVAKVTGMPPCAFDTLSCYTERLGHCAEHCCVDDSNVLCWLHALREGWLDE